MKNCRKMAGLFLLSAGEAGRHSFWRQGLEPAKGINPSADHRPVLGFAANRSPVARQIGSETTGSEFRVIIFSMGSMSSYRSVYAGVWGRVGVLE